LLVDLDAKNIDEYHREIKEIQQRLMVKRRMREVEQSKIYVDIEGIKRSVEKIMRESFNRYMSFLKHGLDADSAAFRETVRKKAVAGDVEGLLMLSLPRNEINELFETIVVDLRDEFVSSAEHGLNWFLSVRIRHGTFSGQLRSPLEAANLITQRDRDTGAYKSNEFWLDKILIEDAEHAEYLDRRLAKFSKDFDDLVQEMLSDWFQIKKETDEKGMFNFVLTQSQVHLVSGLLNEEATYDQFIDGVFSIFTDRLNWNLEQIRKRIEREAERRVDNLLTSLLIDVTQLNEWVDTRDLTNAIRAAQTEMRIAFDRVIEWFRLSKSTGFEPFLIEDAVTVSLESVKIFAPTFEADIVSINEERRMLFDGKQLSTVVDIFFIIFENIVRHSEIVAASRAKVTINYEDDCIHFFIENKVGVGVSSSSNKARIESIKTAMRERRSLALISSEGGTGFLKIWRIIAHDFGEEPRLDFGFQSDNTFFVDFIVHTKRAAL
jgi:hypothetical protein